MESRQILTESLEFSALRIGVSESRACYNSDLFENLEAIGVSYFASSIFCNCNTRPLILYPSEYQRELLHNANVVKLKLSNLKEG